MGARRINPNLVKLHLTYTIRELADRLDVHSNTVRSWQREGLRPIDQGRPILFLGATVRDFLKRRNASRRTPCGPGLFYCFRCREPRPPGGGMVDFLLVTARSGNLRAICECCGTFMYRRAFQAAIPTAMPGIPVQIVQAS